jgi:hypothetical protein
MIWGPAGAERMGKALPTSQNGEREGDLRARRHQDRTSIAHRSRRGTANAIRRRDPARAAGELPEDHRQSRGSVSPFSAWDKFFPCFEVAPPISDRRPSRSHPGRCSPLARTAVNPSAVHSAGSMAGIATAAAATCGRSRPTPSGGRLMGRSLPRKQWEGLDHWDSQRSEAAREIRGTAAGGGGGPRLASAARPRPPWSPCRARGGTWSPHRLAIMALAAPTGAWAVSGGQALVGLMGRTGGARTAVEAWSSTLCPGLGRGMSSWPSWAARMELSAQGLRSPDVTALRAGRLVFLRAPGGCLVSPDAAGYVMVAYTARGSGARCHHWTC